MNISSKDLARFEFLSLQFQSQFKGELPSQRVSSELGSGLEFVEHRNYFPGDDHRNIDWNIFARLGDLMVKKYREDRNLPVSIMIDSSKSMANQKLDTAREVAAALSYLVLKHFDILSISPFAEEPLESLNQVRGKNEIVNVISYLKTLEATGNSTDLFAATKSLVERPQHAGPVFLISDCIFSDDTQLHKSLNMLKFHHYEPFVIQMSDQDTDDLKLDSQYELFDQESQKTMTVRVTPELLKQVTSRQKEHVKSIESFCRRNRMSYLFAEPDWTYEQIIMKIISS